MISSNTRSSRSRFSSPAQGGAQGGGGGSGGGPLEANKNSTNEASRAFMRRWMEPAVQHKSSFEEAGLMRYGVLENMQPLGTLPKASAATGPGSKKENSGVVRKIVLKPSRAGSNNAGRKKSADAALLLDDDEAAMAEGARAAHRNSSTKFKFHGQGSSNGSKFQTTNASSISPSPFSSSRSPSPPISPLPSSPQPPPPSSSSTLPPTHAPSSRRQSADKELALLGMRDFDDNDEDYEPRGGKRKVARRSPITRRSLTRASANRAVSTVVATAATAAAATVEAEAEAEDAIMTAPSPSPAPAPAHPRVGSEESEGDLAKKRHVVDKVVDDAVENALKYHRYPTAYALRTIYDEKKSSDPQIVAMFEDVFLQRADAETLDQFASLVTERKQLGAKDNTAYLFFSPDAVGSPKKPIPAPYADLLRLDLSTARILYDDEEDLRALKKQKITHPEPSPSLSRSHRKTRGSTSGSMVDEARVNSTEDDAASVDASEAAAKPNAPPETPTRRRTRSDSLGSDSSLSSISLDTPELRAFSNFDDEDNSSKPESGTEVQRRPKIKLKAQPKDQGKPKVQRQLQLQNSATGLRISGGGISKSANKRSDTTTGASTSSRSTPAGAEGHSRTADSISVAEEEEDVSGGHSTHQPITTSTAAAGKTAVAQRKSTASSTKGTHNSRANPAAPNRSKAKARDTPSLSLSPSPFSPSSSSHPGPNSHEAPHDSSDKDGSTEPHAMPGVVRPLFPNLPVKVSALRSSAAQPQQVEDNSEDESPSRRSTAAKAKAKRGESSKPHDSTNNNSPRSSPQTAGSARKTRSGAKATPISLTVPTTRSTRSAVKRTHDELEGTASPVATSTRSNAPSQVTSRAVTPILQPPSKKQRVGPRVKTSPKKNGNTTAGMPRPTGESVIHVPGVQARDQIENDDYCSSCGNNGDLICCDNCSKSFHFECVDLVGSTELPEEWFCHDCVYKRSARREEYSGPFSGLLTILDRTIPRAFNLPKRLQIYFEGIKVGPNGEYDEVERSTKLTKKQKEQEFDLYQQRDIEGKAALCHGCQKSASSAGKMMMLCSACPLYWHLDCVDTPMAHPANPRKWICPAHIDHFYNPENAPLGRRFRKIRGAQVIKPVYTRGYKNNGIIEVNDSEEPEDASGWSDVRSYGRVLRLPAKGIKLDFIEQLRKIGAGHAPKAPDTKPQEANQIEHALNLDEAEAAVSLCKLFTTSGGEPVVENEQNEPTDQGDIIESDKTPKSAAPLPDDGDQGKEAQTEPTRDALKLISQVQKGEINKEAITSSDKQSLRQLMASIKSLLGDDGEADKHQQDMIIAHLDGISDGASTTPEASEEAVTPQADPTIHTPVSDTVEKTADEATTAAEQGSESAETIKTTSDGIEVVEMADDDPELARAASDKLPATGNSGSAQPTKAESVKDVDMGE